MKFAIITHVTHHLEQQRFFAYGPYVREMDVWGEFVDEMEIVSPFSQAKPDAIDLPYAHDRIKHTRIPAFDLLSAKAKIKAFFALPIIFWKIFGAMRKADHIHLRCPGNIGLVGCFAQLFFPNKPKTAKYAGNFDPNSPQPWSYRLQKKILNSTFLTRNMQVLVYGDWPNLSKNIKPFFTATYSESYRENIGPRQFEDDIRFMFVGALSAGKRPDYAFDLVKNIRKSGISARIAFFGSGKERQNLESKIQAENASDWAILKGSQPEPQVREAYKTAHFVLLPSKSEGWPKVVAEAMFWAGLPVATSVSCVPYMLDFGNRGVLLTENLESDAAALVDLIRNPSKYGQMCESARDWSQLYTLDKFRSEIRSLLQK